MPEGQLVRNIYTHLVVDRVVPCVPWVTFVMTKAIGWFALWSSKASQDVEACREHHSSAHRHDLYTFFYSHGGSKCGRWHWAFAWAFNDFNMTCRRIGILALLALGAKSHILGLPILYSWPRVSRPSPRSQVPRWWRNRMDPSFRRRASSERLGIHSRQSEKGSGPEVVHWSTIPPWWHAQAGTNRFRQIGWLSWCTKCPYCGAKLQDTRKKTDKLRNNARVQARCRKRDCHRHIPWTSKHPLLHLGFIRAISRTTISHILICATWTQSTCNRNPSWRFREKKKKWVCLSQNSRRSSMTKSSRNRVPSSLATWATTGRS